jgi:hypothetical protein
LYAVYVWCVCKLGNKIIPNVVKSSFGQMLGLIEIIILSNNIQLSSGSNDQSVSSCIDIEIIFCPKMCPVFEYITKCVFNKSANMKLTILVLFLCSYWNRSGKLGFSGLCWNYIQCRHQLNLSICFLTCACELHVVFEKKVRDVLYN